MSGFSTSTALVDAFGIPSQIRENGHRFDLKKLTLVIAVDCYPVIYAEYGVREISDDFSYRIKKEFAVLSKEDVPNAEQENS